ncbi:ferritin-like domain-containing protein [Kitasatospora sp. NPDC048540]|uniref:ferritin-like domain-containing protein n=1 Tax=unclassified Kitasatospora TaxID=2633591 RepID=UPI00068E4E02|nr:ferritin-like domain-containing protein [Kitasatospora sp. MBT63]
MRTSRTARPGPGPGAANWTLPEPSRRVFVLGAAGAGIGLALTACSSRRAPSPLPYTGDLRTVALAATLENQAVSAYQALQSALSSGKLGPAVPALSAFAQAAVEHHTQHAQTWNAILRDAKRPAVTSLSPTGRGELLALGAAGSVDEVVPLLQALEKRAAQTHTTAAGSLQANGPAVLAAATIAPVEAMHAAALGYLLGGRSTVLSFLEPGVEGAGTGA